MRGKRKIVGIEIDTRSLRGVELVRRGASAVTGQAEVVTNRPLLDEQGRLDVEELAHALGRLFDHLDPDTKQLAFALPGPCFTARTMRIPAMPEAEMRMVVQGELERFHVIDGGGDTFAFHVLSEPDEDGEVSVLVMAVREEVLTALHEAAVRVGATVSAVEPGPIGLLRTICRTQPGNDPYAIVALGIDSADLAIIDRGKVEYYRRFAIGGDDLLVTEAPPENLPIHPGAVANRFANAPKQFRLGEYWLDIGDAMGFATEVQRSLDYHRREFPDFGGVTRFVVALSDARLTGFETWLEAALEGPVSMASSGNMAALQFEGLHPEKWFIAMGSALCELDPGTAVPTYDLYAPRKRTAERATSQLAAGVGAAILILLVGTVIGGVFAKRAVDADASVKSLRQNAARLREMKNPEVERLRTVRNQVVSLRNQSVPLPQIIDEVASQLSEGVGVQELSLDDDRKLRLTGEAANTAVVIESVDRLRLLPYLSQVNVDSIDTTAMTLEPGNVRYFISAQITIPKGGGQ